MAQQSINDTYILMQKILRKNQQGYLSPSDFNNFINQASNGLFNDYRGAKPTEYVKGIPTSQKGYDRTKFLMETLTPFVILDASLTITSGAANKPDNLCETLALNATGAVQGIKIVGLDRWASYANSLIDTPTIEYPIAKESDGTYVFLPATGIVSPKVSYLKFPATAIWNYTVVSNRPTYNPTGSVNLEWDETQILNIVMRAISLMGISIKDQQVVNYAEQQRMMGN